jgi:hypothetical protein
MAFLGNVNHGTMTMVLLVVIMYTFGHNIEKKKPATRISETALEVI